VTQATSAPPCVQRLWIGDWLPEPLTNVSADHWRKREKKLKAAQVMVWSYAKHAGWQPVKGCARLTVTFVFPVKRRRDHDGLVSRVKGVVDGVVKGGWIVDDNTDLLDLQVKAETRPGQKGLLLELEATE
jgi:Holliday junction resolvase RusA-like endonuclease